MAKATRSHLAVAFIPGKEKQAARYYVVGVAVTRGDGEIAVKLDSLPLASSRWEGWINLKPVKGAPADIDDEKF